MMDIDMKKQSSDSGNTCWNPRSENKGSWLVVFSDPGERDEDTVGWARAKWMDPEWRELAFDGLGQPMNWWRWATKMACDWRWMMKEEGDGRAAVNSETPLDDKQWRQRQHWKRSWLETSSTCDCTESIAWVPQEKNRVRALIDTVDRCFKKDYHHRQNDGDKHIDRSDGVDSTVTARVFLPKARGKMKLGFWSVREGERESTNTTSLLNSWIK